MQHAGAKNKGQRRRRGGRAGSSLFSGHPWANDLASWHGPSNNETHPLMDLIFNCPKCGQELEVDASGAGQEITCPSCSESIRIPEPDSPGTRAAAHDVPAPATGPQPINAIAASAAAKVERHLKVPVHAKAPEKLIAKPLAPLEVAARRATARCASNASATLTASRLAMTSSTKW